MKSNIKVQVVSLNTFNTGNLVVDVKILGLFHEFVFEGHTVRVSLPQKKDIPKKAYEKNGFPEGNDTLQLQSYKDTNKGRIPFSFSVLEVGVSIFIPEPLTVSEDFLKGVAKLKDSFSKKQQDKLQAWAKNYGEMSERVFNLWKQTLQWKLNSDFIGRTSGNVFSKNPQTLLRESKTGKYLGQNNEEISVYHVSEINLKKWKELEGALKKELRPPIFRGLLFDAREHLRIGDLDRSLVEMAVACETFLRIQVKESLPKGLSSQIERFIDEANIRQLVTKFFPDLLSDEEKKIYKKLESDLHKLFNARNGMLHSGHIPGLSVEICKKYLSVSNQLLSFENRK